MRNVWLLPTIAELTTWLRRSRFRDVEIVDESVTTTDEQRSTEWMSFESLAAALDPADPDRTVEGWPAPRRVVVVAHAP
jgi:tRNA (mo5U34)-methyltransferase